MTGPERRQRPESVLTLARHWASRKRREVATYHPPRRFGRTFLANLVAFSERLGRRMRTVGIDVPSLAQVPNRRMAIGAAWMLGANGIQLLAQAAYYLILARRLGAEGYGAFVGALAIVSLVGPFAAMGAGNLLVQGLSRGVDSPRVLWSRAVATAAHWGAGLSLVTVTLGWFAMRGRISFELLVGLAVSDLLLLPLIQVSGQAFQGLERLNRTAQVYVVWSVLKVAAAAMLTLVPGAGLRLWTILYPLSTGICALLAVLAVSRELGWPRKAAVFTRGELREGLLFSVGDSARSVYNDIDKAMLARLGSLGATGVYGAAYRMIDIAFAPVRSLLASTYPRFFSRGKTGVDATSSLARRLLPLAGVYSLVAGAAVYMVAPLVPLVLGQTYVEVVPALRWLAILPLLRSIHYFAADALTGAGHQGWRTTTQVAVALLNVGLNLVLIPAYSWAGAAWASIFSDGVLAVALWIILSTLAHRALGNGAAPPPRATIVAEP